MNAGWGLATVVSASMAAVAQEHQPVVWALLGYQFEAAGMIAAIFGCVCARLWNADRLRVRKQYRLLLDMPVSALTFGAAVGMVIAVRPEPLMGLMYGTGVGVVGEGLFRFGERMVKKSGLFDDDPTPPIAIPPAPPPDLPPAIQAQIDELERRTNDVHE